MPIESVWCSVLQTSITRVTNLEGQVTSVICSEYDESDGTCRAKAAAMRGGPLSMLLEQVSEHTLGSRSAQCDHKRPGVP